MCSILVVDDAAFLRTMLKQIFTEAGFSVVAEAENGIEAIRSYKTFAPDLVTMDVTMPDMDGLEALAEIRKFDPRANVIMCSAMGSHDMVLRAIKSGAKDFLVKPFQRERVIEAAHNILGIPESI